LVLGCGITRKKLLEQDPVGSDSHERLTEVHEHRDVENAIRVKVQVFYTIVLEKSLEEIAGRQC
jgi:hypothetical protein